MIDSAELTVRLRELAQKFNVPGAAAAVLRGDKLSVAYTGCANLDTGQPVRSDTLFAAGSITKVFNAALVMTLVDDGVLDLDAPVVQYLPNFVLADSVKTAAITVRMLLCHTAGLPAVYLRDDIPAGPDVLARYMSQLASVSILGTPGQRWAYSNVGMVTLGWIVEVLAKKTWDEALTERILQPLGLNATTDANKMLLTSTAVGHLNDLTRGSVERAPSFRRWFSNAPAGSTMWCDVEALIKFARMHINGGRSEEGSMVLSANSVKEMQTPQVDLWNFPGQDHWGLGWGLREGDFGRVVSHAGGNIGMASVLFVVPEQHGAVAILTNGTAGGMLHGTLAAQLLAEQFEIPPAAMLSPLANAPTPPSLPAYAGKYISQQAVIEVRYENEQLIVEAHYGEELAETNRLMQPTGAGFGALPSVSFDGSPERFIGRVGQAGAPAGWMPIEFFEFDADRRPRMIFALGMLAARNL